MIQLKRSMIWQTLLIITSLMLGSVASAQSEYSSEYGPVAAGEDLYSIAKKYRAANSDLTADQWAFAIFAINRPAFGNSPNELERGVLLKIPNEQQVRRQWQRGLAIGQGKVNLPAAAVEPVQVFRPSADIPNDSASVVDGITNRTLALPAQVPPPTQDEELLPTLESLKVSRAAFSQDPLYDEALAAVGTGRASAILSRLLDVEESYAGDPDYDYALGVMQMETGRPQDALFPLLRASRAKPNGLGIRLDLGRAYFETGENESARRVFEELRGKNPPPRAAEVIDSYLKAIERRAARYEPRLVAVISLDAGHDSNANSASDLQSFAGFLLDSASRSSKSAYAALTAKADYALPITPRWRWLLSGEAGTRNYFDTDATQFTTQQGGVNTGLSYRRGNWELSSRVGAALLYVDGEQNSQVLQWTGGWNWRANPFWNYRSSAKIGTVRYEDVLSVRDVDQWVLSGGAGRRFNLAFGSEFGLDLIVGGDDAVETTSPNSRDLTGLGLNGVVQLAPRWRMQMNSNLVTAEYDGKFFGLARKDVQWSTVLGLQFTDNRWQKWTLGMTAGYVENQSDIDLFEYDRLDLAIHLSRLLD